MSDHGSVGELIDLSSPVSWNTKLKVFTPLIPLPANQNIIPFSPVDSNPFDIVAAQTNILPDQDDPFELAFSAATSKIKTEAFSPKTDAVKKLNVNNTIENINENSFHDLNKLNSPQLNNNVNSGSCFLNKADVINKPSGADVFSPTQVSNGKFVPTNNKQSTGSNTTQLTDDMESGGTLNKAFIYSNISSIQYTSNCSQDGDFNDSVFTQGEINFSEVAKEAEKIARLLSESANTFSQSGFPSDTEDDIMSCEPFWVCNSSDDEADSLRKDPALNLRVNYSSMSRSFMEIKKSLEESDALKRFKSRKRRSLGIQTNDELTDETQSDEKSLRRSQSLGSRLQEYNQPTSGIIPAKQLPVAFVKPEENISAKLKSKKPLVPAERKPLKALIPLQNMTRNFLQNREKVVSSLKDISPTQKINLIQPKKQGTPIRRILSGSPKPVASSTPAPSRKRHSFGSKPENTHKSRSQFSHVRGAARRSSSASSGIPTPISLR